MQRIPDERWSIVFSCGSIQLRKTGGVLLHFLQRAQADDLGLVFAERKEALPVSKQMRLPRVAVYFVQDGVQEIFGREEVRIEEDLRPRNVFVEWGF